MAQSEGRDDIMSLREQIMQLQVVTLRPQQTAPSNPSPLGNVRNENRNQNNMSGEGNNQNYYERPYHKAIECYCCESWGNRAHECPSTPSNGNWGKVVVTSNLSPKMHNQVEGTQGHQYV